MEGERLASELLTSATALPNLGDRDDDVAQAIRFRELGVAYRERL
jgi:hypothetical protein